MIPARPRVLVVYKKSAYQIYVRERVKPATIQRGAPRDDRVVLFVHGAGTPAEVAFDVPYADYSWMAFLAAAGFDAFSMDMTGYGRSTRPNVMNDVCNLSAEQQEALGHLPCRAAQDAQLTTIASDWHDLDAVGIGVEDHAAQVRAVGSVEHAPETRADDGRDLRREDAARLQLGRSAEALGEQLPARVDGGGVGRRRQVGQLGLDAAVQCHVCAHALVEDTELRRPLAVPAATEHEQQRRQALRSVQRQALRSARWYEQVPRYVAASATEFAAMMDNRRSPVMARLPVGMYLGLTRAVARMPAVEAPLRRLLSQF